MKQYRITRTAQTDLDQIWDYIAIDDIKTADRFIDELIERIQTLAVTPGVGRTRPEFTENLLCLPFGNYLIFYRSNKELVEIIRILSTFRDLPSLFE